MEAAESARVCVCVCICASTSDVNERQSKNRTRSKNVEDQARQRTKSMKKQRSRMASCGSRVCARRNQNGFRIEDSVSKWMTGANGSKFVSPYLGGESAGSKRLRHRCATF